MADRYLLESGAPDGYLLEDGSGVLSLESTVTIHQGAVSFVGAGTFAAAPALQAAAAWSVTGAATFAAAGVRKTAGAWAVTGAATFAAAGSRKTAGAIALQGAGIFTADGVVAGAGVVYQGAIDVDTGDRRFDRVRLDRQKPLRRAQPLPIPASVTGEFLATLPRPTAQFFGEVEDPVIRGEFTAQLPAPIAEAVGIVGDGDATLCELVELAVAAAGDAWLDG